MTPDEFVALLGPAAEQAQRDTGIPAGFTIAQAAVESGWGTSRQCLTDFNYFGIKAIGGWNGETELWQTREVVNGHSVFVMAPFRKYPDLTSGLEDHARFLTDNPRYKAAFEHTNDSCAFAQAVADAGYATDPHYAETIIGIINKHDLKKILDVPAASNKP